MAWEDLGQFARKPDGNAIATFFNRPIADIVAALKAWGGRYKSLAWVDTRPFCEPFANYCVGGSMQAFSYSSTGWTVHTDNSTTIVSGLPMSVARLARCIAVRITHPHGPCLYPCVSLEYHDYAVAERTRVICAMLDGNRWRFAAEGEPLSFEDISIYSNRRIADRFTIAMLEAYLVSLGIPRSNSLHCEVYSIIT